MTDDTKSTGKWWTHIANFVLIGPMRRAITKTEAIIVEEIRKHFELKQAKNARYSLRAFAKSLDIEASNLSEILSGKRALTLFVAEKILANLDCSRERAQELLAGFTSEFEHAKKSRKNVTKSELTIAEEGFHQISSWYHMAILTFLETNLYDGTPQSIAKYFGLPMDVVESALKALVDLDLLAHADGKHSKLALTYRAPKEDPSGKKRIGTEDIIIEGMGLAKDRIMEFQHHEKEYWAQYISFNPERMQEAKTYFREAVIKFITSFTSQPGERSEVFQLSFQMFPLNNAGEYSFPEGEED